jgi:hypothetical protein
MQPQAPQVRKSFAENEDAAAERRTVNGER